MDKNGRAVMRPVRADRVDNYAPVRVRNKATGRMRTAFVKQDDTLLIRESQLSEEELEAADVPGGNVRLLITAGTQYTEAKPGHGFFLDASFDVVVPGGNLEEAQDAIIEALRDMLQSSGLPAGVDWDAVKSGMETVGTTTQGIGVKAASVMMGSRRDGLRAYGDAAGQARDAINAAIGTLDAPRSRQVQTEAGRRLTAKLDAAGRWRDKRGRYVKSPGSVVVVP